MGSKSGRRERPETRGRGPFGPAVDAEGTLPTEKQGCSQLLIAVTTGPWVLSPGRQEILDASIPFQNLLPHLQNGDMVQCQPPHTHTHGDHGRAWYQEGESYFYKQGVCVLSLEEKECQGEELSQSPPGMDGTPCVEHRPGGLPEEVAPAGLLSLEVEVGRRRRKTPA